MVWRISNWVTDNQWRNVFWQTHVSRYDREHWAHRTCDTWEKNVRLNEMTHDLNLSRGTVSKMTVKLRFHKVCARWAMWALLMAIRQTEWHTPCQNDSLPFLNNIPFTVKTSGTRCHGWRDMVHHSSPESKRASINGCVQASLGPGNSRSCRPLVNWWLPCFGVRKGRCSSISWKVEQKLKQLCTMSHRNVYELPSWTADKGCSSMVKLAHTSPLRFGNSCNIFDVINWTICPIVLTLRQMMSTSSQLSRIILEATDFKVTKMLKQRRHAGSMTRTPCFTNYEHRKTCPMLRQMHQLSWRLHKVQT